MDKESLNIFRLVNKDFKGITESPRFLRVLKVRKLASIINYEHFDFQYDSEGYVVTPKYKIQNIALNGDQWKNKLFKFFHD